MQLRTVKKPKNKAFDFGSSQNADTIPPRKGSIVKDQGEKEGHGSSNEVNYNLIF
jgi:hypothetical protein